MLYNVILKVLGNRVGVEKKIIRLGIKEIKLLSSTDNIIVHIENSNTSEQLFKNIQSFIKLIEWKQKFIKIKHKFKMG